MIPWNPTYFTKNVPSECLAKLEAIAASGGRLRCVAFPPAGGNRWSIIADNGFFNRNIPDECHAKMVELRNAGHQLQCVAFPPAGDNRWSIITNKGFFNRNVTEECHAKMIELRNAGHQLLSVAFPPAGGNRWSIVTDKGFFNRNVTEECHAKMIELRNAGHQLQCVAFPYAGGNRWSIITDKGFFNRNVPTACHRVMCAMAFGGVGSLAVVAYHPSAAFAVVSGADPKGHVQPPLVIGNQTFSLDTFATNLKAKLDGLGAVKYGFMLRHGQALRAWATGPKRTADNPPAQAFTVYDWFNPASVTKTIAAVAVLQLLIEKGLTIDEPIHKHLPSAWNIPDTVKSITVKEMLNHTSGFRASDVYYDDLRELVESGIELADKVGSYQNSNYGLARIIAAYVSGHEENDDDQGEATSKRFMQCTQANIFDRLHIPGVQWRPDADAPTEFYPNPPGDSGGTSYGDWTLRPGSAGVHLSLAELSSFVHRLSDGNVLLPTAMRSQMDAHGLGWLERGEGKSRYWSKGGYFKGTYVLHSLIAKYETGVQAVLVVNGPGFDHAALAQVYESAWTKV